MIRLQERLWARCLILRNADVLRLLDGKSESKGRNLKFKIASRRSQSFEVKSNVWNTLGLWVSFYVSHSDNTYIGAPVLRFFKLRALDQHRKGIVIVKRSIHLGLFCWNYRACTPCTNTIPSEHTSAMSGAQRYIRHNKEAYDRALISKLTEILSGLVQAWPTSPASRKMTRSLQNLYKSLCDGYLYVLSIVHSFSRY